MNNSLEVEAPEADRAHGFDLAFLSALQVSDTFFPTGMYTLSHGLEAFAQSGLLSKADLEPLLRDYLESVLGPGDGVALSLAHQASEDHDLARLMEIDRRLFALKLVREPREASRRVGKRMLTTAVKLRPDPLLIDHLAAVVAGRCPGNSAVAFGAVTAALRIARREAMLIGFYSFAAGALGAAMRLIRLDHEEAQLILAGLRQLMVRVASENIGKGLEDMRSFAPLIDIMGAMHERARVRLFIS